MKSSFLRILIGEENRLGFSYDDTEHVRFYPDKVQKYGWHFWGKKDELDGELTVKATNEGSNNSITILEDLQLIGPNSGTDQHAPSTMSLPKSGMWKLDAIIGENLFGSV
ncbi:hypothetical protein [Bacillus sp. JJ722]|uniref:hypothetical protein n=1 Tax=Bacillus sp. JJ722 TaxID=3122973 RepID=UPI003000C4A2